MDIKELKPGVVYTSEGVQYTIIGGELYLYDHRVGGYYLCDKEVSEITFKE